LENASDREPLCADALCPLVRPRDDALEALCVLAVPAVAPLVLPLARCVPLLARCVLPPSARVACRFACASERCWDVVPVRFC